MTPSQIIRLPFIDCGYKQKNIREMFNNGWRDGRYNTPPADAKDPLTPTLPSGEVFKESQPERDWMGLAYAVGFLMGQCLERLEWSPYDMERHRDVAAVSTES